MSSLSNRSCGLDEGALPFRRPDRLAEPAPLRLFPRYRCWAEPLQYRECGPVRRFPPLPRLRLPIPRSAVFAAFRPFLGLNSSVLVAAALFVLVLPSMSVRSSYGMAVGVLRTRDMASARVLVEKSFGNFVRRKRVGPAQVAIIGS